MKRQLFLAVECQLICWEKMIKLDHHLLTIVAVNSAEKLQEVLEQVGESLMRVGVLSWCQIVYLPREKGATLGTSLVVQWLRLWTPNAVGLGSIPGQGTRSHMPYLRGHMPQRRQKIWYATTKTWHSQTDTWKWRSLSRVHLFATHSIQSIEFSRLGYWSG